jgi:hypothetical protein
VTGGNTNHYTTTELILWAHKSIILDLLFVTNSARCSAAWPVKTFAGPQPKTLPPERKYQSARHEHQTSKQGERLRQRRAGQRAWPRSLKVQGTAATPQMWSRPIVAETCGCGLRAGCSSRSRTGLAQEECQDPGSNRGPSDLQSDALPTELSRLCEDVENCTRSQMQIELVSAHKDDRPGAELRWLSASKWV